MYTLRMYDVTRQVCFSFDTYPRLHAAGINAAGTTFYHVVINMCQGGLRRATAQNPQARAIRYFIYMVITCGARITYNYLCVSKYWPKPEVYQYKLYKPSRLNPLIHVVNYDCSKRGNINFDNAVLYLWQGGLRRAGARNTPARANRPIIYTVLACSFYV